MVSTGQDTVNSMESLILAGNATTDTVTQMVTYSFDLVENSLNNVSMVIQNDMEKLGKYEDAGKRTECDNIRSALSGKNV